MIGPGIAARHFEFGGRLTSIRSLGSGNINRTWLLTTDTSRRVVLQKINTGVFKQPGQLMANLSRVSRQMAAEMERLGLDEDDWRVPRILPCIEGGDGWVDETGGFWRAMGYIEGTVSTETISTPQQAEQAGVGLGRFHRLLASLDPGQLYDTLPGFHNTPRILDRYESVQEKSVMSDAGGPTELVRFCRERIDRHRGMVDILEKALAAGRIHERTIHGDPKIANILFCSRSGRPLSMIDLDTVKPGLILWDLGDFFRSIGNPAGEETTDPSTADFDLDRFEAGLRGYGSEMKALVTEAETALMVDAIRLMTVELGIRFFTDYLEGSTYFRIDRKDRNLLRAAVQFQLAERILEQAERIRALVEQL